MNQSDNERVVDVARDVQPRGRPVDPTRRAATLTAATDHVLGHGLAGSSLRPLAEALGTSHRMLLYDFGTKEALLAAVLAESRRRLAELWRTQVEEQRSSAAESLRAAWSWMTAAEQEPYLRLFFEVQVDAMRRPAVYPDRGADMTRDWLAPVAGLLDHADRAASDTATAAVAALRGLIIDRLTTGDRVRTDRAAELVIRALTGVPADPPTSS